MEKKFILSNPLRLLENKNGDILQDGGFGALLARAGVGKTALLVQIALFSMMRDKNVLHISLNDPVEKVCLRYEELFKNMVKFSDLDAQMCKLEPLIPKRFVMTFRAEGFSIPKLQERLNDLTSQDIFIPNVMVIDGVSFEDMPKKSFLELKELANQNKLAVWFTARTHRHQPPGPDGIPASISHVVDLFEVIIELQPQGKDIYLKTIKGETATKGETPSIALDPTTMLLKRI